LAWTITGTGLQQGTAATLSVTNTTVGDIRVVATFTTFNPATLTVSGGGVTTWTYYGATFVGPTTGVSMRTAWGPVTSTGSQTITAATTGGTIAEIVSGEFVPPASTTVSQDGLYGTNHGTGSTIPMASLTPSQTGDLYWGYAIAAGTASSGGTSGFVYLVTGTSNAIVYSLNAPSPSAPVVNGTGGGDSIDGLLQALGGAAAVPLRPNITSMAVRRASVW
jgi:hypothetical protein